MNDKRTKQIVNYLLSQNDMQAADDLISACSKNDYEALENWEERLTTAASIIDKTKNNLEILTVNLSMKEAIFINNSIHNINSLKDYYSKDDYHDLEEMVKRIDDKLFPNNENDPFK